MLLAWLVIYKKGLRTLAFSYPLPMCFITFPFTHALLVLSPEEGRSYWERDSAIKTFVFVIIQIFVFLRSIMSPMPF